MLPFAPAAHRTRVCLASLLLLAAGCGDGSPPFLVGDAGRIRVVHVAEVDWQEDDARRAMEQVLDLCGSVDVVFAHDDAMALGARAAAEQRGRKAIRFVGVGAFSVADRNRVRDGVLDASVERRTGGTEAIDLALLALHNVGMPKDLVLGPRVWTGANIATGGTPRPGAWDVAMADARLRHPEVLTNTPAVDVVFRVAMVQGPEDEPYRAAMNADLRRRADYYPQVELVLRSGKGTEEQRALVRQFLAEGCSALLVAPVDAEGLVEPCRQARQNGLPVIVIGQRLASDDYTCFVGADDAAIGTAAGDVVRELLGGRGGMDGAGSIVVLRGPAGHAAAEERHRGFVETLGLRAPQ